MELVNTEKLHYTKKLRPGMKGTSARNAQKALEDIPRIKRICKSPKVCSIRQLLKMGDEKHRHAKQNSSLECKCGPQSNTGQNFMIDQNWTNCQQPAIHATVPTDHSASYTRHTNSSTNGTILIYFKHCARISKEAVHIFESR